MIWNLTSFTKKERELETSETSKKDIYIWRLELTNELRKLCDVR